MNRISRFQPVVAALAMMATATAIAEVAYHAKQPVAFVQKGNSFAQKPQFLRGSCCDSSDTLPAGRKAVLDGTLTKSKDKGYVIQVDSATTPKGKELRYLQGKEMPLPEKMSEEVMEQCSSFCDQPSTIECTIVNGKITKVKSVAGRDMTKPGTKSN